MSNQFDEFNMMFPSSEYAEFFSRESLEAWGAEMQATFASGNGIVELDADLPDLVVAAVVKTALRAANGASFVVKTKPRN